MRRFFHGGARYFFPFLRFFVLTVIVLGASGIYVQRIIQGAHYDKPIEFRTVREA